MQYMDQTAILAGGQSLVPDLLERDLKQRLGAAQIQSVAIEGAKLQASLAKQRREVDRQAAFQRSMQSIIADPTSTGVAQLYADFPEFRESTKAAWEGLEEGQRKSNLTRMGAAAAHAIKGNTPAAIAVIEQQIEADKKGGGEPDEGDLAILEALRDPKRHKEAIGLMSVAIAGAVGPEHAKSYLESQGLSQAPRLTTTNPGDVVFDEATGEAKFQNPYPQIIPGQNGAFYQRDINPLIPTGAPVPPVAQPTPAPPPSTAWRVISVPGDSRDGGARTHAGWDIAPTGGSGAWHPQQAFRIERPRNGGKRAGLTADVVLSDGKRLTLMHLQKLPKAGTYQAGELAAVAGQTGNARRTPPHFHVEARDAQGNVIDPRPIFGVDSAAAAPVRVRSVQEYNRLPQGAQFYDPNGNLRTKS